MMARLIDAEKLNAVLQNQAEHLTENGDAVLAACLIVCQETVERQPTIEAAPVVHGYWREYNRSALVSWKNGEPVWVDRVVYYCDGCSFGTIIKHNYCPRCGQKMDGCVSDG